VVAVLDALNIPKAHFCGYSMGGWVGFGMARYARHRVHSLIIGGACPCRESRWDAFRQVDGTDPDAFIAPLEEGIGERIPQATFVSLPGLTHVAGFVRSDLVVPHLMQFSATMCR
jgi:pimeloyl-ACP methyl ester carboxylesterase